MENWQPIVALIALVCMTALAILLPRMQRLSFDPARWQTRPKDRWRLIHDLLRSERLRGMSHDEILALLGNPDYESGCSLAYYLTGKQFGDKLRIRLSPDGRLFKAKLEYGC